jgi:hypothetical protein
MNNCVPSGLTASTGIHWSFVETPFTRSGLLQFVPPFVEHKENLGFVIRVRASIGVCDKEVICGCVR